MAIAAILQRSDPIKRPGRSSSAANLDLPAQSAYMCTDLQVDSMVSAAALAKPRVTTARVRFPGLDPGAPYAVYSPTRFAERSGLSHNVWRASPASIATPCGEPRLRAAPG